MLRSPWPDIDEVLDLDEDRIVACRSTTIAEDFFEHHFPTQPIVPGVLQLSWLEHAGGVWVCHWTRGQMSAVIHTIERVSCIRVVTPGDCVHLRVDVQRPSGSGPLRTGDRLEVKGAVTRQNDRMLRARFILEVVPYCSALGPWTEVAAQLGVASE